MDSTGNKKRRTPKQIAALLCVAILVCVYLVTFIVACLDTSESGKLFAACLLTTIGLPILLWIFIWFYGLMKKQQPDSAQSAFSVSKDEAAQGDGHIQ